MNDTDHKSFLCVGGPLAGRRYAPESKTGFTVPARTYTAADDPASSEFRPNKTIDAELVRYRVEPFHTPQGSVSFWVPERQTPLETITLLLETYERALKGV